MTPPDQALVIGARRLLGRDLTPGEREAIDKYLILLAKWQRVHRLVGSTDREWMVIHLVLDSLSFLGAMPPELGGNPSKILDLGSGAGVPGVPLAIVMPDVEFTLLEARQRRASFLAEAIRGAGLENCRVVAQRAESVEAGLRSSFDAVVMRCAGNPDDTVPIALGFARPGGSVILSGPPRPKPATQGRWVEVQGAEPAQRRRFLVVERPLG